MSVYLHVFMVSKHPERCIAFEFHASVLDKGIPKFDIELVVWGMERDQDLISTVDLLITRGWRPDDIHDAISKARVRCM